MAANMATTADSSTGAFNAFNQTFTLLGTDGKTKIPITVTEVDFIYTQGFAIEVNYGSQIGASIVMLLVMLTMTPLDRFIRITTQINLVALALNVIRCVLLSLYFTSTWFEFYTILSGDVSAVTQTDYNVSVVGSVFAIAITILFEAALAIQAWSMIRLWPRKHKWAITALSAVLLVIVITFKFVEITMTCESILYNNIPMETYLWIQQVDLTLTAASIFWFCFLFVMRLVIHMWTHRSILPSVKGLSAMEVLVMTNGILMIFPVIFAGLEFGSFTNFESGSLTYTSVIVVLPLGTLVAQRLANPSAFGASRFSPQNANSMTDGSRSMRPFARIGRETIMTDTSVSSTLSSGLRSRMAGDKGPISPIDLELARIDGESFLDLETGGCDDADIVVQLRLP